MTNITPNDTICAIATAPGCGGIAVARISGPEAIAITNKLWKGTDLDKVKSHTAHLGYIIDPSSHQILDQALATVFRAPHSYTGENVVELSIHGSTWIQQELLRILIDSGARMAQPGEFTRRAFTSGQLDLTEAEAVADLIASSSAASHRVAMNQMRGRFSQRLDTLRDSMLKLSALLELELDFSEEDVEFASRTELKKLAEEIYQELHRLTASFATGAAIKDGIPVAIVGATNAGKSTLLNTLLGEDRAIVSDIRGTTRDIIEDTITIHGTLYRIIDTAGLRTTADIIESLGIERAMARIKQARIIIWVIDPNDTDTINDTATQINRAKTDDARTIIAINKTDISGTDINPHLPADMDATCLRISAATGKGIEQLKETIHSLSGAAGIDENTVMVTNARHYQSLTTAKDCITRVIEGLDANLSCDFIAQDLRETIHYLSSITGTITTTDLLQTIFQKFCIGK